MKESVEKKIKKIFNLYNLAILVCIIIIIASIIVIIEPDFDTIFSKEETNPNDVKVIQNDNQEGKISEKDARNLAKKQFKELGENSNSDELEVLKVEREGEEYYYISSSENTLEIKIETGEITRINSVKVEK